MLRCFALLLAAAPAATLRTPGALDRRKALSLGASTLVTALPPSRAALATPDDPILLTVPLTTLTASLSAVEPREVVITGANSGVGLAGAKILTAAGHRVLCACRTEAKAQAAAAECNAYAKASGVRAGGEARGAVCDLASLESVRSFADSLKGTRVDSLVLNAGVARGTSETEARRTQEGFEETIGVNHLGHFLLASLMLPNLEKSASPRLVVTASPVHDPTSGGGNVGSPATLGDLAGLRGGAGFSMVDGGAYDPDKAYKDSKLCNMMFMAEASRRLSSKGITVNAFSPGLIADPNGFFRNQSPVFASIFNVITKVVGVAESNEFGGSALAYMATDPALNGVTGAWYDTLPPGKHQLAVHAASSEAQQADKQMELWQLSSKLVGI